jgi:menaquinone-dependent protoporphyrinogen oxidase
MTSVLLVIAGLVVSPTKGDLSIDAVSSASKNVNNKLCAHTTSEIAFTMKGILENGGCKVDVISADSVNTDIEKYDMVILGSGIYGMMPHGSIKQFVLKNENELKGKKTALYAVCGMICSTSEKNRLSAMKLVDKMQFGLSPVSKTVFRGRINDTGAFFNWIGNQFLKTPPPGDYREWDKIKEWTLGLLV